MARLTDIVDRLRARRGARRVLVLAILLLVGVGSLAVHFLIRQELDSSALLYVGIPYVGALVIAAVQPTTPSTSLRHRYRDFSLTSLIVFLGSSIVLFEGFVCVLMFLPIYFLVATIAFATHWLSTTGGKHHGKRYASVLPLIVLVSSFEGTTDRLSAERTSSATATRVAHMTPAQVMANLVRPIDLDKDRNWMLSLFPMPYRVEAESLHPGDVHHLHTRYHRWFVTNTHEGVLRLEILEVEPTRVRTRIVHDTTLFSSYLEQIGTEISLTPITPDTTKIALTIDYRRKLDPAWYFHPLQKYAMGQMAGFFIDEVMIRDAPATRHQARGGT